MKTIVLALAATLACGAANAQSVSGEPAKQGRQAGFFAGAGAESFAFQDGAGDTYGVGGFAVRAGYNFNKYLGLSVEAMFPTDTYEGNGSTLYSTNAIDMGNAYGIYIQPRLPLGRVVGLYGRFGYFNTVVHNAAVQYPNGGCCFTHNESVSAFAYGAGIDVDLGRHTTLAFDLTGYSTDFDSAAGAGLTLEGRF